MNTALPAKTNLTGTPGTRICHGCDVELPPKGPRERNPKKWCSPACRVAAYYRCNPDKRSDQDAKGRERARAGYTPVQPREKTCAMCGDPFSTKTTAKYCGATCRYRSHHVARRDRVRSGARAPYTQADIANRDGWDCHLCGGQIDRSAVYPEPTSLSMDHVIPLSLGGDDTPENVRAAHLRCNLQKGAPRPT